MTGCMIFAAGFGTRMRPLTDTKPKPLVQVAGQSLLTHAMTPALTAGLSPIIVNAHYKADQVEAALAGTKATVIREEPDVLETGGGLKHAATRFTTPQVATMNSDAVWNGPNPFEVLQSTWDAARMDALLLCVPHARAWGRDGRSDFVLRPDGRLERGEGWVYTGAQMLLLGPVVDWPEQVFSLNVIWDQSAKAGRLFGVEYPGHWCDVGTPEAIGIAEKMTHV